MRKLLIMGLLSFLFGCNHSEEPVPNVTVDLSSFSVAGSKIGKPVTSDSPIGRELANSGVYAPRGKGLELGTNGDSLEYAFITLADFNGTFLANGRSLELNTATSEGDIREQFGDPYWVDRQDGEVILFYEYHGGDMEVQFEFPDGASLGYVTISRAGVLSDPEQRNRYGVDKPWPPQ
ncbi:MAG TPA: hypothetical protein VMM76_10765 [Pirellulaceae bacterium]|nr:hypothetical protein [Pirellulaceae bacterium]